MSVQPTPIDELSNSYLRDLLVAMPELTTETGLPGGDETAFTDYSPEGEQEHLLLRRRALRTLDTLTPQNDADAVSAAALRERLELESELIEAGETTGELNVIASPVQTIRDIFDLMPTQTPDNWATIAARLAAIPDALAGYRESLSWRRANGPAIARRQLERCAEQCDLLAAERESNFSKLVDQASEQGQALRQDLARAADSAREAYADLARFLREEIAEGTTETDAVGRERYERFSRLFLGARVDLDETYEWGKEELASIIREQEEIARDLYGPGVSVREAMDRLNADPARSLHGTDALRGWMQETADNALSTLSGTYFDIPKPLQTIECMVLEDGTGGIYYTGPTDDFSRPGRMWWSVPQGVTSFATWQEKTTVFHEGVPGHHLQVGLTTYMRDSLNDWRRHGCWVSGHGEGWALYAEQLMAELGFQDDPGDRMGVLDSMRLRAARVVVDLGVHLGKPAGSYGSGAWDHDSAWAFLRDNVAMDPSFLSFELDRYLGWPGQAPSYKIGQRIWNELREEARTRAERAGEDFDLKAWHTKALSLGSVGLDVMREALR
ncbi:DUF885 domain-containing protein [Arcanobacterium haemolyticum]|nr:DUF885 domain-containing protein [Arcanobacterium haemolyticum]